MFQASLALCRPLCWPSDSFSNHSQYSGICGTAGLAARRMAQPQPADMGSGRTTSGTRSLLDEYRVDPNSTGDLFPEQKANSAKRKIALALVLLAFGSICIIAGVNVFFHNENGGEWRGQ